MSTTLPRLRQDHQNVALVLELIEGQVESVAKGGDLNFNLIEAAVLYFQRYFTLFHQPKEDIIFGHLVGHVGDYSQNIFPLLDDHRELEGRIDILVGAVRALNSGDQASRDDLCQATRNFVERQREHLGAEEKFFYPEAERLLTAQQWAEVDRYLPDAQDPLLQSPRDSSFAALVQAMSRLGQSHAETPIAGEQASCEVVGIFERTEDFQAAIDELLSAGFDRADLSLLASSAAVGKKLGYCYDKAEVLANDQSIPRAAYVPTGAIGDAEEGIIGVLTYIGALTATGIVVASGGTLAALVTTVVLGGGAGGLIGTVLAKWIGTCHGRYLEEQLDRGGLLLWVRAQDAAAEQRATDLLKKHSGLDVHSHLLPISQGRPSILT